MAKYIVDDASLTAVADAIRAKTGKSASLTLAQMPTEIESIEGGGSSTDTTELEEQIADLTAENTELKTQNANLTAQNTELTTDNEELTTENDNLSSQITTLNGEKSALTLQVADLQSQVAVLETENAELTARIEELEGSSSGDDTGDSGATDQTALAGAYTDATFTTRAYTWDELVERGDYETNGNIYPYENEPSVENAGYWYVYGQNYAFVIPDTITTGVGTEGCKALVLPSTTKEFKTGMEGTIDTIYIKATTPPTLPWEDYFCDCNYNGNNGVQYAVNIVVPVGCGNAYKTATNWSAYADYITEGEMPI